MSGFGEFKALLSLSKHERFALLFLCSTLVLGGAVYWFRQSSSTQLEYRYAENDSLYTERSASVATPVNDSTNGPRKFNLNAITYTELMQIPKMRSEMAKRILFYRAKHKRFRNYNDLMRVPGMTDELFAEISYYITIGN
jgi:DNA uptake protein ComE-like DNA-binding protein